MALFQGAAFLNGQICVQRGDELAELFSSLGGKHQRFRFGQAFELLREHRMLGQAATIAFPKQRPVAHEDLDEVNLFRGQAKSERSDLEFSDRSVREPFDSNRADYIKQRVSERIKQSSMTVVYVSEFSAASSWVNWEVERSIELGRKVVAFHKGDTTPKSLPRAVKEHNIKVIRWADLAGELD
jgi:hypothetical protein